jgi:hypothetical protein
MKIVRRRHDDAEQLRSGADPASHGSRKHVRIDDNSHQD